MRRTRARRGRRRVGASARRARALQPTVERTRPLVDLLLRQPAPKNGRAAIFADLCPGANRRVADPSPKAVKSCEPEGPQDLRETILAEHPLVQLGEGLA